MNTDITQYYQNFPLVDSKPDEFGFCKASVKEHTVSSEFSKHFIISIFHMVGVASAEH